MVAGGSEAAVNEPSVGGFNSMQALSTRNDDPQHASRPFDKDRDGFVIGEGAGALILEEYEHAKARGAKIYCGRKWWPDISRWSVWDICSIWKPTVFWGQSMGWVIQDAACFAWYCTT